MTRQCPFHRDQADYLRDRGERGRAAVTPPQGYFAVLSPLGEHLAQKTESQPDTRASGVSIPRLAKLLWLLVQRAGADTVGAIGNRAKPSLILEFQRPEGRCRQPRDRTRNTAVSLPVHASRRLSPTPDIRAASGGGTDMAERA